MTPSDPCKISSSEITEQSLYLTRRVVMRGAVLGGTALATGWLYRHWNRVERAAAVPLRPPLAIKPVTQPTASPISAAFTTDEPRTPLRVITHYNNFYEFDTDKEGVAPAAEGFVTHPWKISISGDCRKPATLDLDDLLKAFSIEERIYRMRCVEGWSMVIPWNGFPLFKLLDRVEPTSNATHVAFETLLDTSRLPKQKTSVLKWPYVEGLRMDEAMHPLTILATGIYGQPLPPQDGAPIRLVVPWKYGFKGIKSIVQIRLVDSQPPTTWSDYAPQEYGFFANVNPMVDHPRWSQRTERRLGEFRRRDTLPFNGYGEQVASVYKGMDLTKFY